MNKRLELREPFTAAEETHIAFVAVVGGSRLSLASLITLFEVL
jgi:hypothetical protein